MSIAIIIIAATIVSIGGLIVLILYEIRKTILAVKQTTKDIHELKASLQSGIIESMIAFGRKFFQKQPTDE